MEVRQIKKQGLSAVDWVEFGNLISDMNDVQLNHALDLLKKEVWRRH